MDISELLKSIEGTDIASSIRDSLYLFPLLESIHVVGLALVFGTIAVIDLRLLGLASLNRPFRNVASDILKWTWLAFGITLFSGGLMFSTNAIAYAHNPSFQIKMVLLLLSGINMGIFELTTGRSADRWGTGRSTPGAAKAAAVISLTMWIAIIFLGRWIGFTVGHSSTPEDAPPPELNLEELFPGANDAPSPAPPTPPDPK